MAIRYSSFIIPCSLLLAGALAGCSGAKTPAGDAPDQLTLLVGTYTNPGDTAGIYSFRFNQQTGAVEPLGSVEAANPSFLTLSPDGRRVYAVSENDTEADAALAFDFDPSTGRLTPINSQPTAGTAPCYILADSARVVTANYNGGSITVFPVNASDGSLQPFEQLVQFRGTGADTLRQSQPHLHCVRLSPDGRYLFADDLGTDRVYRYTVNRSDSAAYLTPAVPPYVEVAPASGPRHLEFAPDGSHAYLINELSGAVTVFDYDPATGTLAQVQSVQADTVGAQGSGDIHISPDGRHLYASNRLRADGLAIFAIDPSTGQLAKIGYQPTGIHPRNFAITPNGEFLLVACRDDNAVEVYRRDPSTGLLTPSAPASFTLPRPVCLRFTQTN